MKKEHASIMVTATIDAHRQAAPIQMPQDLNDGG